MSRVLIIEDEKSTATPVKEALELDGISADIAGDGVEGLEKFRTGDYDLVLLDLKMPKLSGEEVLQEIRKIDPFVDVIIYTNYSEFLELKKLANIGIDGYINKGPEANLDELITLIEGRLQPLDEGSIDFLLKDVPQKED